MNALATVDLSRLAKICGLFSSEHAGERAAAAWRADQIVRSAGLDWTEVLAPGGATQRQTFAPSAVMTPGEILARHGRLLTAWERKFLASLIQWRGPWTDRQTKTFTDIHEKIVRASR